MRREGEAGGVLILGGGGVWGDELIEFRKVSADKLLGKSEKVGEKYE